MEGEEELIETKKDTTIKHGTFLLANLVKKYPIWIGVKKTTSSFRQVDFNMFIVSGLVFFIGRVWTI